MPTSSKARQPLPAFIGGSGVYALDGCGGAKPKPVVTPYQSEPTTVFEYVNGTSPCLFLPRHGAKHQLAPHQINYRANLWSLKQAGAGCVVAFNAVGGISDDMQPGTLCIPDQLIDYTWGRESTFHELGGVGGLASLHVDFTEPYNADLRIQVLEAAKEIGLSIVDGGVYGCTQGPRLETAAEIRRLARDGCGLVGMTGMPEAVLARELGLPYCSITLVVNRAAGLDANALDISDIDRHLSEGVGKVQRLAIAALPRLQSVALRG